MKPLLNSKAVCEILAVSPAVLSRMVHSNRIPYVLLSGGKTKLTVRFGKMSWRNGLTGGLGEQYRNPALIY